MRSKSRRSFTPIQPPPGVPGVQSPSKDFHPFTDYFRDKTTLWRPPGPASTYGAIPAFATPVSIQATMSPPTPIYRSPAWTPNPYSSHVGVAPIMRVPEQTPYVPPFSQGAFKADVPPFSQGAFKPDEPVSSWPRPSFTAPSSGSGGGWEPDHFGFSGLPDPIDHMTLPMATYVAPRPYSGPLPDYGASSQPGWGQIGIDPVRE